MKIDIEGAEALALAGASKALARKTPPILSEIHPRELRRVSDRSPAEFIAGLARLGYSCYLLEEGRPTRKLDDYPADVKVDLVNVLFERAGPAV